MLSRYLDALDSIHRNLGNDVANKVLFEPLARTMAVDENAVWPKGAVFGPTPRIRHVVDQTALISCINNVESQEVGFPHNGNVSEMRILICILLYYSLLKTVSLVYSS